MGRDFSLSITICVMERVSCRQYTVEINACGRFSHTGEEAI